MQIDQNFQPIFISKKDLHNEETYLDIVQLGSNQINEITSQFY